MLKEIRVNKGKEDKQGKDTKGNQEMEKQE